MKYFHRLNTKGFAHWIVPALVIVTIGGIGTYMIVRSHALTATGINTTSESAVNTAYKSMWAAYASTPSGWTGSRTGCNEGSISAAARTAFINSTNFARRLNDLTPITGANITDTKEDGVQRAALMQGMNYNRWDGSYTTSSSGTRVQETYGLMHTGIPTSWLCYSTAGAAASASSDLAVMSPVAYPETAIRLLLDDRGSANMAVGHRRWLLKPDAAVFAFGESDVAAAIQVRDMRTDTTNNNPFWVSWPSAGYFPAPIEPGGRWSMSSHEGVSFSGATVTVSHNGANIPVSVLSVADKSYPSPTMVWQMPANTNIGTSTARFVPSGTYTVTIRGVVNASGTALGPHTYNVNYFTPY